MMELDPAIYWFGAGLIFLAMEFLIMANIGFLFLSFGSFTNAVVLQGYPELLGYQYINFAVFSFSWFAVFWKFHLQRQAKITHNFNIIGNEVQVYQKNLKPSEVGKVKWSGTVMNAMLDSKESEASIDEILQVKAINGNILICTRKK